VSNTGGWTQESKNATKHGEGKLEAREAHTTIERDTTILPRFEALMRR
jgi:hypothetical protein